MPPAKRPIDPKSFRVAIICALPREAAAVTLLLDELWTRTYGVGKDPDRDCYVTGRMGQHNVVLATLPGMGTIHAARSTVKLRGAYTGLRIALLVGICGGLPQVGNTNAYLGDVVISKSIVQYDFGNRYPYHFDPMKDVKDSLQSPSPDIRPLIAALETEKVDHRLKRAATGHLKQLQINAKKYKSNVNYQYLGAAKDRAYLSNYHHKHRKSCKECASDPNAICSAAIKASCADVGCDPSKQVQRRRAVNLPAGADFVPQLFIGRIGSTDYLVKSGLDREKIAADHGIIAVEMEGAAFLA
ncbi:hypothetical protein FGADI_11805 [Fusarium gaditjirri]|uniref:Nucleoside phosphorylase domain-containing protein n=1 Tax=Fusarium gaditjirri TaxID=282569 RepID=A0A8H4STP7_9HYPO|nr:hypothetical protein FGADI_11805 [Fusarium gaditjirri]